MAKKIRPHKKKTMELAAPKQTKRKKDSTRTGIRFFEEGESGIKENYGFITEAYNAQLFWPTVQPLYSRLRRSMPEIVMIRQTFTSWARNIKPIVELPDEPTDDDKKYQDFIESDFENMDGGFTGFIDTCVNQVPFMGFGWWEALPAIRDPEWRPPSVEDDWRSEVDDGLIGLRRLAWRDSSTFFGWDMTENRKLKGMKQQVLMKQPVTLPLDKSLHITFGDPTNPEGLTPLEAVWRLERMKFGYEVVLGIGAEHAAGHLSINKTEQGDLSPDDRTMVEETAKNLLSAQEGNYAFWPFGIEGQVLDVPFQAAGSILDIIKHYSILVLSVYTMQWIALNTLTQTGAQASQVDSTDTGIFTFNAMIDGFASQYDQQIGKRLFLWNKDAFPDITKRPKIKFSHIDKQIALNDLSNFFRTLDGILPLTDDDYKALRQRSGFLPLNVDTLKAAQEARKLDEAINPPKPEAIQQPPKAADPKELGELGGAGSGFYGHKGRDALNLRGGSLPKGPSAAADYTESAEAVYRMLEKHPDGFSYRPEYKSVPEDGYMTAGEDGPIFSPELPREQAVERIQDFLDSKADLLEQPDIYIGGWLNPDDNQFYLDASGNYEDVDQAILVAVKIRQKAIFDLDNYKQIYVSDYLDEHPEFKIDESARKWYSEHGHDPVKLDIFGRRLVEFGGRVDLHHEDSGVPPSKLRKVQKKIIRDDEGQMDTIEETHIYDDDEE